MADMESIYILLKPRPKEILNSTCLVREDALTVTDKNGTNLRYCFLLNDWLLITRERKAKGTVGKKYKTLTLIQLGKSASVTPSGDQDFIMYTAKNPYTFTCPNSANRDAWVQAVTECLKGKWDKGKPSGQDQAKHIVRTADGKEMTKAEYETLRANAASQTSTTTNTTPNVSTASSSSVSLDEEEDDDDEEVQVELSVQLN